MTHFPDLNWRLLSFGFLMTFFSSPGQTYLIALYSGEIRTDLGLSHSDFGAVYSAATLVSAAALLWSGRLADDYDTRRLSMIVVILLAAGLLLIASSQSLWTLLVGIFVLRQTGQGLMTHISATAMIRYFDRIKGKTMAISSLGYTVGEALLPMIVIALIASLGWRDALRFSSVILLLVMLPAIWWLLLNHDETHRNYLNSLNSEKPHESVRKRHWTRSEMLRDSRFFLILPAYMTSSMIFTGFFFHQIHLVDSKGWELQWWGQLFVLYAGVSLSASLIYGLLVDRFGAVRILPYYILPLAVAMSLLYLTDHVLAAAGFMVMTGLTAGGAAVVNGPFLAELYGSRHLGAIKAVGTAVMVLSSALSPFAMGWMIDHGIPIHTQALGAALYILLASLLAKLALLRSG